MLMFSDEANPVGVVVTEWEFPRYDFPSSICQRHSLRLHIRMKNSFI